MADYGVSLAMGNMWLAAGDVGLGGVWLGVSPFKDRMDAVSEILNLPDSVRPFAIFAYGYPAREPKAHDRFDPSKIHEIK